MAATAIAIALHSSGSGADSPANITTEEYLNLGREYHKLMEDGYSATPQRLRRGALASIYRRNLKGLFLGDSPEVRLQSAQGILLQSKRNTAALSRARLGLTVMTVLKWDALLIDAEPKKLTAQENEGVVSRRARERLERNIQKGPHVVSGKYGKVEAHEYHGGIGRSETARAEAERVISRLRMLALCDLVLSSECNKNALESILDDASLELAPQPTTATAEPGMSLIENLAIACVGEQYADTTNMASIALDAAKKLAMHIASEIIQEMDTYYDTQEIHPLADDYKELRSKITATI